MTVLYSIFILHYFIHFQEYTWYTVVFDSIVTIQNGGIFLPVLNSYTQFLEEKEVIL